MGCKSQTLHILRSDVYLVANMEDIITIVIVSWVIYINHSHDSPHQVVAFVHHPKHLLSIVTITAMSHQWFFIRHSPPRFPCFLHIPEKSFFWWPGYWKNYEPRVSGYCQYQLLIWIVSINSTYHNTFWMFWYIWANYYNFFGDSLILNHHSGSGWSLHFVPRFFTWKSSFPPAPPDGRPWPPPPPPKKSLPPPPPPLRCRP